MQKIRILVVENERIVSLDIQRRLKNLGYEVVAAAVSGEEAIQKASAHRPDLVLMDIMLDGQLDGIAAAETIRCRLAIPRARQLRGQLPAPAGNRSDGHR